MIETLSVPEISCDHCKQSIEGALGTLEGVTMARVDVPGKVVTVEYDSGRLGHPDIVAAIEAQGYDVAG